MQKQNFAKIFFALIFGIYFSATAVTNKTFFMPRAIGQDAVLQNVSDLYMINKKEKESTSKPLFNLTNIFFYDESTNRESLGRYFSINNHHDLKVKGYATTGEKDIAAEWLRIISDGDRNNAEDFLFSSKISLSPKQTRFGDIIKLHKRLDFISKYLWVQAYFPIVQVETDANLREWDKEHERAADDKLDFPEAHNAKKALDTLLFKYGKITDSNHKIAGLADIDLKLGYKILKPLSLYAKLVIPTGYKPKAEYLFEPILGNGGHWGLGCGLNFDLKVIKHFNFLSNLDYVYLFENEEKRSFDLKTNGPWSRYMAGTNTVVQTRPIPLINLLTKDLDVTPGSMLNWVASIHGNYKSFNAELGYNFWYREKEHVKLSHHWNENIGIAVFGDSDPNTFYPWYDNSHPNNNVKINENMIVPYQDVKPFTAIDHKNLNIDSAVHPDAMSHKIYLSLGFDAKWHYVAAAMNFAGSYELADSNKALEMWSIWWQTSLYF